MQSSASPFVAFVRQNKSPQEVAQILGCNVGSARDGLRAARETLADRSDRVEQACRILLHSGLTRPMVAGKDTADQAVNRWRAWQRVVLGEKKAA